MKKIKVESPSQIEKIEGNSLQENSTTNFEINLVNNGAETILKSGRNPKSSHTSRGNRLKILTLFCMLFCMSFATYGQTYSWEIIRTKANEGDSFYQYMVGMTYKVGSEEYWTGEYLLDSKIQPNMEKAILWLSKAANQGYEDAYLKLADCYLQEKDFKQTVYWDRKAATAGIATAQYMLGSCYKKGIEVEEDGNTALYWYEKALANKEKLAQKAISDIEFSIEILKEQGYSSSRAKR